MRNSRISDEAALINSHRAKAILSLKKNFSPNDGAKYLAGDIVTVTTSLGQRLDVIVLEDCLTDTLETSDGVFNIDSIVK